MLIRMVRMAFEPEKVKDFLIVFNNSKDKIRAFPGCKHMELLQDLSEPNIFMTYSYWDSETDLNNYRKSDLFGQVWPATKKLFSVPAQAFSVQQIADKDLENLLQQF